MSVPRSTDAAVAAVAAKQHGAFTRAQVLAAGGTPSMITSRVRAGFWTPTHLGVYVIAGSPPTFHQRVMAAVLSAGSQALAASRTAAVLWGLTVRLPHEMELLVPRGVRVRRPGLSVRASASITARDRTSLGGIPTTSGVRTLIDLASVLERSVLEKTLDEAVRLGVVRPVALRSRISELGTEGRRGLGPLADLAGLKEPTSGEIAIRFLEALKRYGVPPPMQEYVVRERGRVLGRVDFAYPGARIFIELDGYGAHSAPVAFERDRPRQTDLVLYGWRPLRFTWKDVTRTAQRMCNRIRYGLGLTHILEG